MPFKIFRSSAGSGKTFTLVKEYLRLSLASTKADSYRSILAITFTNKAAEEMKSRVLEVLVHLSKPSEEPHAMAEILRNELQLEENELRQRSHRTLRHMLHHYADISISTIDHFTHQLIRSFAQDLELSVNFEVEMDTERLKQEIVNKLLAEIGSDPDLTKALMNVLESQMDDEKSWSVVKQLTEFSQTLFTEESRFHLDQLKNIRLEDFNTLRNKLNERIGVLSKSISDQAEIALAQLKQAGISESKLYYGSKGVYPFIAKAASAEFNSPNSYVRKAAAENKWMGGKASKDDAVAVEPIIPDMVRTIELMDAHLSEINYLNLIYSNLYGVALLDKLHALQKEVEEDEDVLHIGEFNHLVSNVVMTETAPFIYERIGYRYNHFLVDEFQDTSVLQWFNLLPLIDESLSHDNLCLIVGDAKQSIYRWRGGDVRQFVALPEMYRTEFLAERIGMNPEMEVVLNQREKIITANTDSRSLDKNYRSYSSVVGFNNELFEWLKPSMPDSMAKMYEGSSQEITKKENGLVELRFFKQEDGERSWPEYDQLTFDQIEEWINASLDDGFSAGDIAIILRRNKDAVKIARHLVSKGFNVVSNESLLINSSPKVRLLVNLAIFLSTPEDTVNTTETVQHLGLVRGEEQLTSSRLLSVTQAPEQHLKLLLQQLYPATDWDAFKREGVFGLFELLKHTFLDDQADTYLNFFFDEVLSFSRKHNSGLIGFLEHWKDKRDKLSIALPESNDAIRITSIHKSKGLEFPVVIHPFADYPFRNQGDEVWAYLDDENLAPLDRIRIPTGSKLTGTTFSDMNDAEKDMRLMDMFNELYVALTRAKARLYTSGKLKNKDNENPSTAIQYVYNFLQAIDGNVEETQSYVRGERTKIDKSVSNSNGFKTMLCGNPNWKQRIRISRPSKDRWKTARPNDARNMGILIHQALAHIRTLDDVDAAIAVLIEDGRLGQPEADKLRAGIEQLLSRAELKELYNGANTIRNEADILLSNGSWVRPDRVVYNTDAAWVVDYKTGKEKPNHQQQMHLYKQAMHELGFKQVSSLLVYLNEQKVVSV
jgi:ATP-dependent exoDNAse (exonuclease V) beta subunit